MLALASGVTPDNAALYAPDVDAFLVATGINITGDFYRIDPLKLRRLLSNCRQAGLLAAPAAPQPDRWYLNNMAPNIKGPRFAWLDPSAMYLNARSFHALLDDVLLDLDAHDVDVVAGIDAMGFVLGAAVATRLNKGFLSIRKAGKIPVDTDTVEFVNYSGRSQQMEMRKPAFAPGTRVLLVDQWIETGGTMNAAVELVERQQGVVAGVVTVCIEENPATGQLKNRYRCFTAVQPGTAIQSQCNHQTLASFTAFTPAQIFPASPAAPDVTHNQSLKTTLNNEETNR